MKRAVSAFKKAGKWNELDARGRQEWQRARSELNAATADFDRLRQQAAQPPKVEPAQKLSPSEPAAEQPKPEETEKVKGVRKRAQAFQKLLDERGIEFGWIDEQFAEQYFDPMAGQKSGRGAQGIEIDRRRNELRKQAWREVARALEVEPSETATESGRAKLLEKLQEHIKKADEESGKSDNDIPAGDVSADFLPPEDQPKPKPSARDQLYEEAKQAKIVAQRDYPALHKKIVEASGLTQAELNALLIPSPEGITHPSEYENLANKLARNAPGAG